MYRPYMTALLRLHEDCVTIAKQGYPLKVGHGARLNRSP
ncbi:hypothetical protein CRENPOLYSF1_50064 [Crenothrix polyspora]|uniref:Uncharacterized protein n=1 Tax=Crenothrix polyspora TaxID=360316 RepID=A0A1R4HCS0_9GAMM|nr:hypothetical protein CRENPOLYSF1_50064 [Crenothrix polyspora]